MKKVLVTGPNYYNFLSAVRNAFVRNGFETVVEGYDVPLNPYSLPAKFKWKLCGDRDALLDENSRRWCACFRRRFDEVRPDIVFILNGEIFDAGTLDYMRGFSAVAIWMFDSLDRLPRSVWHVDHVDAMFCFDRRDAVWYESLGRKAFFLPQACDTDIYRPIPAEKDIDILFVGNMYNSPKRKSAILDVIRHFPDRKILVYGLFQPWYKGILKWAVRPYKSVIRNVNLAPEEVNRLYNRSRVVLNIHEEHQKDGANPRLFEICGSGALQVCDTNPYVKSLFGDSVMLYSDRDEMFAAIERALVENCQDCAGRACEKVRMEHTFDNRIREVLDILQSPGTSA